MNISVYSFSISPFITKKFNIMVTGVIKILDKIGEYLKISITLKFFIISVFTRALKQIGSEYIDKKDRSDICNSKVFYFYSEIPF